MIANKVKEAILKNNLIEEKDSVIVGVSGGPDSICLLHILNSIKDEYNIKIYAAHLNHRIRGIESQKDAAYVAKICDDMGITCFIKAIDVVKYCEENRLSVEEGARTLRYNLFFDIKEKVKANKIAVAHNVNDQVETILMRIMRGTGLKGLKGIAHKRSDGIIRPLLDIERRDIEAYCEMHDLKPRIDASNLEDIYTRNKIRLKLLPYMMDNFNPNIVDSICRMTATLSDDSDFIEEESNKYFHQICESRAENIVNIDLEKLNFVHMAIKNRIIRKAIGYIMGNIVGIEQKHIEDIKTMIAEDKLESRLDLPKGIMVYKKKNSIIITNEEILYDLINYNYKLPKSGYIKIKELNYIVESKIIDINEYDKNDKDEFTKFFDSDKIYGNLIVRNRKNGDKIKMLGLGGSKKLKDLFIDLKVPKEDRDKVPILCDDEGIIWVIGHRISEDYKVDNSTKNVLRVQFKTL